jgi:heparin binding hemagglutinin HbhA
MPTSDNTRRQLDPTPFYAVVGATDLAVERVRAAARGAGQAQHVLSDFDPKTAAQEVPMRAVAVALTVASKAEAQYEELAQRGKGLYERVRTQQSTQDLLNQAGSTLSRTRGAVTTARKAADDTATAVRGTLGVSRREAGAVVGTAGSAAESATDTTSRSAKKTATRARKNTTATKSAAKGVRTSATRTASKAPGAAKDTARKVGD